MSSLPGSFDDFLAEISASLSSSSGEAALRRINAERVLRLALEEIVQQRHDLQIRVLADSRIAGQAGADILMQIDDYELRLALLDAPMGNLDLTIEQLEGFRSVFEENPSTEVMVLTWTTEELQSQKLNLQIIEYLKAHPEQLSRYLAKVKPLQDVIREILTDHMKVWDAVIASPTASTLAATDVRTLFERHIKTSIKAARERSYRNVERKMAALRLSEEQEISMLSSVLAEALQGMPSKYLAGRLAQLPKRGGR